MALHCAECETELTTADADHLVPTEEGPVHRECYEGDDSSGGGFFELLAEEEDRRREMGDPPVTMLTEPKVGHVPSDVGSRQLRRYAAALGIGERCAEGDHDLCEGCGCGCHRDDDDGLDRRDPPDERGLREAAEEEGR